MSAPYYTDEHVTLYLGDWREEIPEDYRADLIVTDPPYGETSLEWDRWPKGWPALAARHADAMWCFGSMRMFLDQRDEFAAWKLSQDVVWEKQQGSGWNTDDLFAHFVSHGKDDEAAHRAAIQTVDLGWRPVVGSDPARLWSA